MLILLNRCAGVTRLARWSSTGIHIQVTAIHYCFTHNACDVFLVQRDHHNPIYSWMCRCGLRSHHDSYAFPRLILLSRSEINSPLLLPASTQLSSSSHLRFLFLISSQRSQPYLPLDFSFAVTPDCVASYILFRNTTLMRLSFDSCGLLEWIPASTY